MELLTVIGALALSLAVVLVAAVVRDVWRLTRRKPFRGGF